MMEYIGLIVCIIIGVKVGTIPWGGFLKTAKRKAQRAADAVRAKDEEDADE